jgi:DNA polymerase-3 subunit gamma/tau
MTVNPPGLSSAVSFCTAAFWYTLGMKKQAASGALQQGTLYRRYRPADFSEVRGQEPIVTALKAALAKGTTAHAYLFSGGRGTGKTSVARILAKELGVSPKDLYEIDAASNRGIDDIRELREGVWAMPFESPYKFYIIDEAHMLTKEAWNALLKTLEEPPRHAVFVLATTEMHKVPDTIQSRCEVYSFKQPTREVLAQIVADVSKKEGFTLERSAAELVALLADGSFRDALSILQKVLSTSADKNVSVAEVEAVSGAPKGEAVRAVVRAIAGKDANAALAALSAAAEHNDPRTLARLIIHRLRIVLLLRFAPDLAAELSQELSEDDAVLAREIVKSPGITSETLRILLEAHATSGYAAVPILPLELAIIDICTPSQTAA